MFVEQIVRVISEIVEQIGVMQLVIKVFVGFIDEINFVIWNIGEVFMVIVVFIEQQNFVMYEILQNVQQVVEGMKEVVGNIVIVQLLVGVIGEVVE